MKRYATIINSKKAHKFSWHYDQDDKKVMVHLYRYKSTKDGDLDYCNCFECRQERRGKRLYITYEILPDSPFGRAGSIIRKQYLKFYTPKKEKPK